MRLKNLLSRHLMTEEEKRLAFYLDDLEHPVLLAGFPRSGNTWTRFVIYNYFNILLNGADRTLTYEELNSIQNHRVEDRSTESFAPGFPTLYRTHLPYQKVFDCFSHIIYVYRNPLDTLISLYYWHSKRCPAFRGYPPGERERLHNIDYFVRFNMDRWSYHYRSIMDKSDVPMYYARMQADAFREFSGLLKGLQYSVDEEALRQSIAMSSFNNIKAMGEESNCRRGMANPKTATPELEHTRSGETDQYLRELDPKTIDEARQHLARRGIDFELAAAS